MARSKKIHLPKGRRVENFSPAYVSLCGLSNVDTSPEPDVVTCLICLKRFAIAARKKEERDILTTDKPIC